MEPLSNTQASLPLSGSASDLTTTIQSDDASGDSPPSPTTTTMAQTKNQKKSSEQIVKHRACDECRSRKLACSKEPDGCSRCRREGLKCHYSPQKPMGRPRKRRHTDDSGEEMAASRETQLFPQPIVGLDTNFSFLDVDTTNVDYLDLLSPLNGAPPSTLPPELASLSMAYHQPQFPPELHYGQFHGMGRSDILGGINFDENDSADEEMSRNINESISEYLSYQVPEKLPSLSSNAGDTPKSEPEPPTVRPFAHISCPCLSQIYLALDALANLPDDISAAMRTARHGARVAHDVINCQYCSLPLMHDATLPPTMTALQNMMMLGALIPATANSYARILEMIDAEAASARKENRMIVFRFRDYGGLWGELENQESGCGVIQAYDNRELNADGWRQAIRALLRIDVYGFTMPDTMGSHPTAEAYHWGLKDVINALEERSRIRHQKIDDLLEAGHPMCTNGHIMSPRDNSKENRNCLKIIEMARLSLDKLVIA